MALELIRESPDNVSVPDGAHESFFVDEDGQPQLKNSDGTVRASVALDGDPLVLNEQSSAPSAIINAGHIYSKDVNGITEMFYRDDLGNTGKETQVTRDGSLASSLGTFYEAANFGTFPVSVPAGATGDVAINTGVIFPLLGDNQVSTLHMRIHGIGTITQDIGEYVLAFTWATAPTLPNPGFVDLNRAAYGHSSGNATDAPDVWVSIFTDITLNSAGEIVLHFDDQVEASTYEAQVHISVGGFTTVRNPVV